MPVTLPLEVFEALEKGLGKEEARAVVKSIEATISEATEYKWATTKEELLDAIRGEFVTREGFKVFRAEFKEELLDAIRREFVTRELFEERMNTLEERMNTLEERMNTIRVELEGRIEREALRLDRKFTVMFVILFFTIIFLNQNALEFIFRILGLIN